MTDVGRGYAFPHADGDESRRLRLLEERLDATTVRRMERLGLASSVRSLEVGAGPARSHAGCAATSGRAAR